RLLRDPTQWAWEVNPLARHLLEQYGWPALTYFKLATTGGAGAILMFVAAYRPRLGLRALAVSCALLGATVGYGAFLNYGPEVGTKEQWTVFQRSLSHVREVEERYRRIVGRDQASARLIAEFRQGHRTFADALGCQLALDQADHERLAAVRKAFPGCSDKDC